MSMRATMIGASVIGLLMTLFVACTSNVVGTGSPPPGGTSGNNPGSTSGLQGSTSSSSGSTTGTACTNIDGIWGVSGTCGAGGGDTCTITQINCDIDVSCSEANYSGRVTGDNFTYSGFNDLGAEISCSGRIYDTTIATGSCTPSDGSSQRCSFNASKQP